MAIDRRSFLRGVASAGAVAASSALPVEARGSEGAAKAPDDAVGMLYDATKCIGCKTCVVACHEANGLPPDTRHDPLYDAPRDLNDWTKNIIKLYQGEDGEQSFMKMQCMHCIDPACVGACMIGALQKREYGIVTWDPDRCIGCRYCQVACPYNVPKFEWDDRAPKIVKCEMCNHLLAKGDIPACCDVCPVEAVIFGRYDDLLAEAERRLEEQPERYEPKIFGQHDGGGTQVIYLSAMGISFEDLGLPDLGEEPVPALPRRLQHGIYQGAVAPVALYGLLALAVWRARRGEGEPTGEGGSAGGDETGGGAS